MASLFQSRYPYFPEEVVLTLPSKYIFSGKSIVLHFLLPFLYKIEFFILPVCNIAISCTFAKIINLLSYFCNTEKYGNGKDKPINNGIEE